MFNVFITKLTGITKIVSISCVFPFAFFSLSLSFYQFLVVGRLFVGFFANFFVLFFFACNLKTFIY